MFLLDGKPLAPGRAFVTADGTQYPANWLRLASPEEKQAIGITEAPDPRPYDQRFYWGYSDDGSLIPKDLDQLKTQWVSTVKQTANTMLSQTDWIIIRANDISSVKSVPDEIKNERTTIRLKSDEKEVKINSCQTVDELAAFVTSTEYHSWSKEQEVTTTSTTVTGGMSSDTIVFDGFTTSSSFTSGDSLFSSGTNDTIIFG